MNNAVANFKRRWINGTNFNIKPPEPKKGKRYYLLVHKPSGANVAFQWYPKYIYISYGETPNTQRGRGIGTKLRALVTMLGIETGKKVYQTGVLMGKNMPNGRPISTYIVRNKLGYSRNVKGNNYNSVFKVGNNNSKVRNVLKRANTN